jgi:hypothetical protein
VSSFKVGDKVWAQATVQSIDGESLRLTFEDDWTLWFLASDCRPVEPEPVIKKSLTTESESTSERYREPTLADLADGPIFCEFRDHESQNWKTGMLRGIVEGPGYPFLCLIAGASTLRYAECRIEAGE